MAEAGQVDVSGARARAQRFVRALIDGAVAERRGEVYRIENATRASQLGVAAVKELAGQGVLTISGETCRAAEGARSWLRRSLIAIDPFVAQHQDRQVVAEGVQRDLEASPLLRLSRPLPGETEAFLSAAEVEAGERIRRLWDRSQLRPRLTRSYEPVVIRGGGPLAGREIGEAAAEARARLNRLLGQLPADCASVVLDICGELKGLQQIESERGWPRRSAKLVLRIGLQQLAGLMGLTSEARGRDSTAIRSRLEGERLPL